MKKLIAVIALVSIITATGAQIAEGLIDRLLKFSVKELLVERVFDELWKSAKVWSMKPGGHQLYHSARSVSYDNLGIKYEDRESYIQATTIVVAKVKNYFFDGSNLKEIYLSIQPRFKDEFSKLSNKEKEGIRDTLSDVKSCFELMLEKGNQAAYKKWLEGEELSNFEISKVWLENNLSVEDITKRIRAGELKETPDEWEIEKESFKAYPDKDIAKFAGRRLKEGGEKLLRKYLEVINLAIADTAK